MAYGRPPRWHRSDFGKKLVAARLRLGLTQAQVASRLGVSQQAYAGWERRTMAIKPQHVARMAEVLAIPLDDLLGANPVSSKPETADPRISDLIAGLSRFPQEQQDRLLGILEDLIYAVKKRRKH